MYCYCAVTVVLEDFPRSNSWPWHDRWSTSKTTKVEKHAVVLVSLKEDISRTCREASTRSCCLPMGCNHPTTCLWGLSLSGSQAWTSSRTFRASVSKGGVSTNGRWQVWVMSLPSASFDSVWGLEICLFWTKLLMFDVKVGPKGSEEWRGRLGSVHSAQLPALLCTGGWRELFHSVEEL